MNNPKQVWDGEYSLKEPHLHFGGEILSGDLDDENRDESDDIGRDFMKLNRVSTVGKPMGCCVTCGKRSTGKALVESTPNWPNMLMSSCKDCTHDDRLKLVKSLNFERK